MHLDTMTEERRRAFDDKKTQSEPVGAGRVHSVKWPEDIRQLADRDADAVVATLEAYRRAAPARSDQHATTAGRVVDRVADQVPQYSAHQYRVARHGSAGRKDAKPDSSEPCRFKELGFGLFENRTELDGLAVPAAGRIEQPESVDKLIQLVAQFARRTFDPCQLCLLDLAVEDFGEDIVRAHDDLQRLAQIWTGDRQQCRAQIVMVLCNATVVVEAHRRYGRGGRTLGNSAGSEADRLHPNLVLLFLKSVAETRPDTRP